MALCGRSSYVAYAPLWSPLGDLNFSGVFFSPALKARAIQLHLPTVSKSELLTL